MFEQKIIILAKSLSEKANRAMHQDESPHKGLLSSQYYINQSFFPSFKPGFHMVFVGR